MRPIMLTALLCLPTTAFSLDVVDPESAARALLAADQAFADLSESTSARNAFAQFMAPDGIMMPAATERAVEGYDQVMGLFGATDDPARQLLWQPQFAEVASAGDMGWTWGTWQSLLDGHVVVEGKYVNVWKKQADGSWKVRVDVGNQRPAPDP